jgi:methionine biosynthesis protein MetW
MGFPEVFEDYEKYHSTVNTGNLSRAKLVEDWIEPNTTVLDVGVGDGVVSEYLIKNKQVKVTGLDISSIACEKARQLGIQTEIRDITNGLGLTNDTSYDYVLLLEVIEHTAYPHRILIDAINHAKKGVVVTVPNSAYIKWRIQMLRGYVPRQSFTHLHFWSIKDFELFCKDTKIRILEFKTFTAIQEFIGMATMLVNITVQNENLAITLNFKLLIIECSMEDMKIRLPIHTYNRYLFLELF